MQRLVPVLLGAINLMAPVGAKAADLVVWWERGYNPEADAAVRETIGAFEQDTGKPIELVLYSLDELPGELEAALEAGQPPDCGSDILIDHHMSKLAFDDRLVDLSKAI